MAIIAFCFSVRVDADTEAKEVSVIQAPIASEPGEKATVQVSVDVEPVETVVPTVATFRHRRKADLDNFFQIFGQNFTGGALKNLVTNKPAPITIQL